jgi:hypothetical protein
VIAAPANEIAIGMKISDLATASPRRRRSARVANARPMLTATTGTTSVHPSVLRIARSMLSSVKTNLKLSRPTKPSPWASFRLIRSVLITG